MDYKLLAVSPNQSTKTPSVAAVAKQFGVPMNDMWIPCYVKEPHPKAVYEVEPDAAMVMLDLKTQTLSTSRQEILDRLLLRVEPSRVMIPESVIYKHQDELTIFVRVKDGGGRARLREGMPILVRHVSFEQSLAEGSCFPRPVPSSTVPSATPSVKSGVSAAPSKSHSVQASNLIGISELREAAEAAVDARLNMKRPRERGSDEEEAMRERGERALQTIHENLARAQMEPPLHNVQILSGNFKQNVTFRVGGTVTLDGRTWLRPDPCVLSHQHLPEVNRNTGAVGRIFAAKRLLAVLPLLTLCAVPKSQEDDLLESDLNISSPEVVDGVRKLFHRGYKIVLVEHLPQLHHGNAHSLQSVVKRIGLFLDEHFANIPVQVVLSIASYYSAHMPTMSRFILPNAGLFHVYLYHYNGQIEPDAEHSFFVCTPQKEDKEARESSGAFGFASLSEDSQRKFAALCGRKGLKCVTHATFIKDLDSLLS